MKEKTHATSKQYVDNLLKNFYSNNNQRTPFARIEDGYVQCIKNPDPEVKDGFITVQIVTPSLTTHNKKSIKKKNNQENFYEFETDEARENLSASTKPVNEECRMVENRYGQLQETNPCEARNASELGIISFWEFSEERGYWCNHSFYVPNPVAFKVE